MKDILQQAKTELEKAFDERGKHDLTLTISELQEAREKFGDKGTMIEDAIRSLTQAKNAQREHETAGDIASSAAFGEAFNSLDQAIESYTNHDNDPL
ncbi:hypothetical protein [Mesobacillus zeae]|uniref:Uncharacterized protein n=1 Tax=Mesobacillus zeae TaxID=1917180 RepID=A0A398BDJ3_9BACI|nr:hypothetical protein [Mesobacillus zeae]RID85726.1 hypothetical protein D1970_09285 [Mesobacillus zeae]